MSEDRADLSAGTSRSPLTAAAMDPENNDYATPPEIWRPLARALGGFDLDPCSGAESTPIAPTRYTKEDDGLRQPWHGDVFSNIPWSSNGDASAKEDWLRKVRNELSRDAVDTIIVLLPSDTSTQWFHEHVMAATAVCFVGPGRISFEGGDRNPPFGLIIAAYGPVSDDLADALDSLGVVVRGRSIYTPHEQEKLVTDGGRERYADDASRDDGDLVVPFGGTDVAAGPPRRRNTCANCPRSMSERWQGDLCPFCEDALVCDHCDFEASNLRGLASHHRQAHPHRQKPEVLR